MYTLKERQMKKVNMISALLILAALMLSGCDQAAPARGAAPVQPDSRDGVAIVFPQESAQFYVGDFVDIHAEVGDIDGFSAAVLTVNNQVYRRDAFASAVKNGDLYQPWVPEAEGVYALQIHCETAAGGQSASNVVNVYVGMAKVTKETPAEEPIAEVTEEPAAETSECPIAMATATGYPFCRSGPGTAYNTITNLQPGQSFPITAVSGSGSWWQIAYNTAGGTCWVWDALVTVCGDTDDVAVITGLEKDAAEAPAEAPPGEETGPTPTWDPASGPTSP